MFKKQPKSKHPIGFMADTMFDFFLPKPKPKKSHKKAFIGLGLFSVACVAAARALDK
jgi:hypothetical protein